MQRKNASSTAELKKADNFSHFAWTHHDEEEEMMQLKRSVFHILRKRSNLNDTMWLTRDADC